MSTLRRVQREVARHRMKLLGYSRINKRLKDEWRDIGAPDYVKRLKDRKKRLLKVTKED